MTVRFGFSIVQRLQLLAESAQRLGSGAPSEPIEGDDEIAALDRVYHVMTHRIQREHAVASVLQKALLPHDLPAMPGLRIDAAYTPAARESEVGGNWYDVFALSPAASASAWAMLRDTGFTPPPSWAPHVKRFARRPLSIPNHRTFSFS